MSRSPMMQAIAAAVRANVPVLLWGNPGQGKTAKLTAYASGPWGMQVETVIGSIREATDFLGFPIENDGEVMYSALGWAKNLGRAEKGLLFLDELTTAAPSVQKAMLRVLQERYVGEYRLPDSVAIVAAANPPETAVDGWDLPAAMANRLMHLDWRFDGEEWLTGILNGFRSQQTETIDVLIGEHSESRVAQVRGLITGFLRARPDLLAPNPPTDASKAGKAWPSPRSWANLMSVMGEIREQDEEAIALVVKGLVGEAVWIEFAAWQATQLLVDPAEAIAHPEKVDWKGQRPDALFALCGSIAALAVMDGTAPYRTKALEALAVCSKADRPDVALNAAAQIIDSMRADRQPEPVKILRDAFMDLMVATGRVGVAA